MRGVAGKEDAAMSEAVHALASEGVYAYPFQLYVDIFAKESADAGQDLLRFDLFGRVRIPAELEIDAPNVVRLAVQEHGLIGMERRVEPEPALGREVGFKLDVGDQEAVAEDLAEIGRASC